MQSARVVSVGEGRENHRHCRSLDYALDRQGKYYPGVANTRAH